MKEQKICLNCQYGKKINLPNILECMVYDELVSEIDSCGLWKHTGFNGEEVD